MKSWANVTWKSYRLSTSPIRCSQCTLGNSPKKSFSTVLFIHTSDYLRCLTRKQSVIHYPTHPENVTTLTCELPNFFIWLKVCCVLSNAMEALKRASCGLSSVAPKRTGCDRNWNARQAMSQQVFRVTTFCIKTCFQSFWALRSHSTPRCAEIQPMSQQAAVAGLNMSISIHALLL